MLIPCRSKPMQRQIVYVCGRRGGVENNLTASLSYLKVENSISKHAIELKEKNCSDHKVSYKCSSNYYHFSSSLTLIFVNRVFFAFFFSL